MFRICGNRDAIARHVIMRRVETEDAAKTDGYLNCVMSVKTGPARF